MKLQSQINLEDQAQAASRSSALVKLSCGVANNSTFLIMLDAHDQIRHLPAYRQRGSKARHAFKSVFLQWRDYERRLRLATKNRMFHLADLHPDHRKKFGDISDAEYFEYWQGVGYTAHQKSKPWITSLQNKYRLSLVSHGVSDPKETAWLLTAQSALELCGAIYKTTINICVNEFGLRRYIAEDIFGQFDLSDIAARWNRATRLLTGIWSYNLNETEERNIGLGVTQLCDAWTDMSATLQSVIDTIDYYSDIYATPGFMKKEKREITALIDEMGTDAG